ASAISVTFSLVEPAFAGDVIRLTAPPGYDFRADPQGQESGTSASGKTCRKVQNWSKLGVQPDQDLRCFQGLLCVLRLSGHDLSLRSQVQLNRLDRPCGDLPGRDVDARRTSLSALGAGDGTQAEFELGTALPLGQFHVCYCHGDGGCDRNDRFCQTAGILTVADLCAEATCGTAPPCYSSCDPRSGRCVSQDLLIQLADGADCVMPSNESSLPGRCDQGQCVPRGPPSPQASDAEASAVPPSCLADGFECLDREMAWTLGYEGYARFQPIYFEATALHPTSLPPEDNVFDLSHLRGGVVRGSRLVQAYGIRPQLSQVNISRTGAESAGGATTELRLSFVTVQSASTLWIRAKEPIGFDLGSAFVTGLQPSAGHGQGDTMEIEMNISAKQQISIELANVRLPLEGGASLFDIVTYNGSTVQDSVYDVPGFLIPAHVAVSDIVLLNSYKQDTSSQFAVEATFGNRYGETAKLSVRWALSSAIPPQSMLKIAAAYWQFVPGTSKMAESRPDGTATSLAPDVVEEGASLSLRLATGLRPSRLASYMIEVEVLAPTPSQCLCFGSGLCQLCQTNWSMEVLDAADVVIATNDALLVGFPLVSEVIWDVFALRAPPQALLDVTLRLTTVGAVPATVLMVTAPFGYEFPYQCFALLALNGTVAGLPVFTQCTGRLNSAALLLDDQGLYRSSNLQLRVTTPRTPPQDNRWYIQGRLRATNTEVCWGVAAGLPSQQMTDVSVEFAALQTLHTVFLLRVTTEVEVAAGGSLVVIPPPGYLLSCDGLKLFFAPGVVSGDETGLISCSSYRQGIQIVFAATMLAGSPYAFGLQGGTAAASAADRDSDVFSLQVLNPSGTVAESSFSIQAPPLQSFGSIEQPYLLWYDMPTPGTSIWVSLGLRVPRRAAAGLETLRVSLPDGFEHTALARNRDEIDEHSVTLAWRPLQLPSSPAGIFSDYEAWTRAEEIALANEAPAPVLVAEVVASNGSVNATTGTTSTTTSTEMDEMPVPQGRNWVNLGQRNEVQMRLISSRTFPACELLLRFPVQLPSRKPRLNLWYVTLAFAANTSGRYDGDVRFVVPGFDFFQQPPSAAVEHAQHVFDYAGYDYFQFSTQHVGSGQLPKYDVPLALFCLAFALHL
ncbi:unnamed protein product, partial [Symbiodinium sp. CCMP2592]